MEAINIRTDKTVNLIDFSWRNLKAMPVFLHNLTTDLNLQGNFIQAVPVWSFKKSRKLKRIDLSQNSLTMIERDAFGGLVELTHLDLSTNRLTTDSLPVDIFKGLISLQELAINYNYDYNENSNFQSEISIIKSLVRLRIDLSTRQHIGKCLCKLSNLQEIQISAHHGQIYSEYSFQNLKCQLIEVLIIDSVASLTPNTFISFPNLKTLRVNIKILSAAEDVIGNVFKSLKVFKGRNMTELTITGNPMRNGFVMDHPHFEVLQNICLQKLVLVGDSILGIKFRPFERYALKENCLQELIMSNNVMVDRKDDYLFVFCAFKHLKIIRIPHMIVRKRRNKRSRSAVDDLSYTVCLPKTLEQLDLHSPVKNYKCNCCQRVTFKNSKSG
ncbi:SLIT3 [Mytilus coruscus]|uniref:SLIT3 n=1 Tax=Mytilus coruscus TaxID=42192 RepID=A0A6J8CKQ2_MYTCO|nr:SLIT3 [Mytilus coruscus]